VCPSWLKRHRQFNLQIALVHYGKRDYNARLRFTVACGGLTRTGSKTSRFGRTKLEIEK
jgi:hypothetical protein